MPREQISPRPASGTEKLREASPEKTTRGKPRPASGSLAREEGSLCRENDARASDPRQPRESPRPHTPPHRRLSACGAACRALGRRARRARERARRARDRAHMRGWVKAARGWRSGLCTVRSLLRSKRRRRVGGVCCACGSPEDRVAGFAGLESAIRGWAERHSLQGFGRTMPTAAGSLPSDSSSAGRTHCSRSIVTIVTLLGRDRTPPSVWLDVETLFGRRSECSEASASPSCRLWSSLVAVRWSSAGVPSLPRRRLPRPALAARYSELHAPRRVRADELR